MPQDPRERKSALQRRKWWLSAARLRPQGEETQAEGRRRRQNGAGFIYSVNRHCVVFSSFGDVTSDKNAGFTCFRTT